MKNTASDKQSLSRLARITPIVRGLLASPTGDQDNPYKPVILKSLTSEEAVKFASSEKDAQTSRYPAPLTKGEGPPLFLDPDDFNNEPEILRHKLNAAITDYAKQHKGKPEIICLCGMGVFYLDTGYSADRRPVEIPDTRKRKKSSIKHQASSVEPDLPLKNKVAVVTGAAGAIGYGICRGLLENGCHLAATDLAGKKLDEFIADLKEIGGERVIGVAIDVTDKNSVADGFEKVVQAWGGIDIVVVNAGIPLVSYLKDIDLEAFRKLEKVNVEGALLTLSEAAKYFILQGTGGDIVVMSTKNVPSPGAGFGAYSATKAACHQLGRIASIELAQYGVRVNMVAPDAVFSEGGYKSGLWEEIGPDRMKARGLNEEQLHEYYRNRNLLKARITGRHVANAVLFFVTHQTPTTGATIPVDGGLPNATPR